MTEAQQDRLHDLLDALLLLAVLAWLCFAAGCQSVSPGLPWVGPDTPERQASAVRAAELVDGQEQGELR